MVKPFDIADLVARFKAHGLDIAEDLAKVVASDAVDWSVESCSIHTNVMIKFGAPILMSLKPIILAEIDKIEVEKEDAIIEANLKAEEKAIEKEEKKKHKKHASELI